METYMQGNISKLILIREKQYRKHVFVILGESWVPWLINVTQIKNGKTTVYEKERLIKKK